MTNNVTGIGNTGSVNPYGHQPKGNDPKPEENPPAATPQAPTTSQLNPDDVLTLMGQSATHVNVTVPRSYDVAKYVTPDQAARIAGLMADFEGQVAAGLVAIEEELPWLSEDDKLVIAANMV